MYINFLYLNVISINKKNITIINSIKKILFIFILFITYSCTENKKSRLISQYYEGFKNSDFNQIRSTVSDTLIITEGDYIMTYSPDNYYDHFKWDSTFKPTYNLVAIESQDNTITTTVSVSSIRFKFLKNDPLICKYKFAFNSGKIIKIENLDCIDVNWKLWQKERDSLVNWVKLNHPELDGFINNISAQGAKDYVKAIELYNTKD